MIDQYFSGIEELHNFFWIRKPFYLLKKALSVMISQQKLSFFNCAKFQVLKLTLLGWILKIFGLAFKIIIHPFEKSYELFQSLIQFITVEWDFLQWCLLRQNFKPCLRLMMICDVASSALSLDLHA